MTQQVPSTPSSRFGTSVLVRSTLLVTALVLWSFASTASTSTVRVVLFVAAVAAVFGGLGRRHPWPSLVIAGMMALTTPEERSASPDGWGVLFIAGVASGAAMWLRQQAGMRWMVASLPFWVYANEAGWAMAAALVLSMGGLFIFAVGPTLPARRVRDGGPPLEHLSSGPVGVVHAAIYPAARTSRPLKVMTVAATVLAVMLLGATAALRTGGRVEASTTTAALTLASIIIAATFAFSLWFAGRVRVRIDQDGVHGRTMFLEHTVPWTEVVAIRLRYVFFPGTGVRLVYYCVRSPTREVAFPSSMAGAEELKASIEQATGLAWPESQVVATM